MSQTDSDDESRNVDKLLAELKNETLSEESSDSKIIKHKINTKTHEYDNDEQDSDENW